MKTFYLASLWLHAVYRENRLQSICK